METVKKEKKDKKGLFQRLKEKKDRFTAKHPRVCKVAKVTAYGTGSVLAVIGGIGVSRFIADRKASGLPDDVQTEALDDGTTIVHF